jgi:hypothetical protein
MAFYNVLGMLNFLGIHFICQENWKKKREKKSGKSKSPPRYSYTSAFDILAC